MSYNLVAMLRGNLINRKTTKKEQIFPIEKCIFSPKDDPASKVLRLELDGLKFFGAR